MQRCLALVSLCLLCAAVSVSAQGFLPTELAISLQQHGLRLSGTHGDHGRYTEGGLDIAIALLWDSPAWAAWAGAPRPHLGGTINSAGGTQTVYAGLTWRAALSNRLFVETSAGGLVHDGYLTTAPAGRARLGTRLLFRESLAVGYQITRAVHIAPYIAHASNAGLGAPNQGLTDIGIRVGYAFPVSP